MQNMHIKDFIQLSKRTSQILKPVQRDIYIRMKLRAFPWWWLRLCASTEKGTGSILGQGTKIPDVVWHGQKKNCSGRIIFSSETEIYIKTWIAPVRNFRRIKKFLLLKDKLFIKSNNNNILGDHSICISEINNSNTIKDGNTLMQVTCAMCGAGSFYLNVHLISKCILQALRESLNCLKDIINLLQERKWSCKMLN